MCGIINLICMSVLWVCIYQVIQIWTVLLTPFAEHADPIKQPQKKEVLGHTSHSSVPYLCFMVYILYDYYTIRFILPVGRRL